jgi:hypothetical protein
VLWTSRRGKLTDSTQGKAAMNTEKKPPESHIEVCFISGEQFNVSKRDNSGYLRGEPIFEPCREDVGDYL